LGGGWLVQCGTGGLVWRGRGGGGVVTKASRTISSGYILPSGEHETKTAAGNTNSSGMTMCKVGGGGWLKNINNSGKMDS